MRTLLQNNPIEYVYQTDFRCSDCGWTFTLTLGHLSPVVDYFDEREAKRGFDAHRCADFVQSSKRVG
jgi:hypothetical protein